MTDPSPQPDELHSLGLAEIPVQVDIPVGDGRLASTSVTVHVELFARILPPPLPLEVAEVEVGLRSGPSAGEILERQAGE